MLSHFHEHKRENKNVSFWGFLKLHYLPGHPDDKDDDDDMQLPFKNQESVYHIDILSKNYQPATDFSITRYLPLKNTLHPEGMPCRQFNEIFRPPRI